MRLEKLISSGSPFSKGFAVLLTNDPNYWKTSNSSNTYDADFRINEGANYKRNWRFFKGKNPNVTEHVLSKNWVEGTHILYIGKAGGTCLKGKKAMEPCGIY